MADFYRRSKPFWPRSSYDQGGDLFKYAALGSQKDDSPSTVRPAAEISGAYHKEYYTPYFRRHGSGRLETTQAWENSDAYDMSDQPPSLFEYSPPKVHINEAYSHPSMRSHVIPLISRIAADYPEAVTIEASSDLSRYSSKLVKKAQSLGFPVSASPYNPNAEVTNDIDFSDHMTSTQRTLQESSFNQIPSKEIATSMAPVRDRIRAKRESQVSDKVNNNQFQPHLPGMEGF